MSADAATTWPVNLFLLRGDDRDEIRERLGDLRQWLAEGHSPTACAAHLAGMPPQRLTLALIAADADELTRKLDVAQERLADPQRLFLRDASGVYFEQRPLAREGKIAFLFPGEGAQYLGMLHALHEAFPIVRQCIDICDQIGAEINDPRGSLRRFLLAGDPQDLEANERDLRNLDHAMYSVLAADWAIASLLQQAGVIPAALAGHSAGELAALLFAGAVKPEDELGAIVSAMSTLEEQGEEDFALLAVGMNRPSMLDLLAGLEQPVRAEVAMDNCPHQVVVVGAANDMLRVEHALQSRKKMYERLALAAPYHTPLFEPFMGVLRDVFAHAPFEPAATPVYSCSTGELFPDEPEAMRSLCVEHWRRPVAFVDTIRNMHRDGYRLFVEAGPRGNLTSFAADILRGADAAAIACNVPRRDGVTQFLHALAQLAAHGAPVRLDQLYAQRGWTNSARSDRQEAASHHADAPGVEPALARADALPPSADRAAVVDSHWRLMRRFLDAQGQVMQGYLAARGRQAETRPAAIGRRRRSAALRGSRRASDVRSHAAPAYSVGGRMAALTPSDEPLTQPAPPAPVSSPEIQAPASQPATRPMVGQIVEQSPGHQVVTHRVMQLAYDHYASHHTVGGRKLSRVNPDQHGLPIVPMTFTVEMMAECGELVFPELQVLRVENIQMMRWLAVYAERPHTLEITATALDRDPDDAEQRVLVRIKDLGRQGDAKPRQLMAAIGTVVLAQQRPEPPMIDALELTDERPCQIDIPTMYNNLFHGELFQGVLSLGRFGEEGIEGRIEVLPRDELFGGISEPNFISDPVLLDVAMHPPCAWHLSQPDQWGRIVLPFELQQVVFYGERPPVGAVFTARTRVVESTPRHFTHVTDTYDDQGRVWARINRVKLWRFYLPFRDVNFHGPKDVYIISEDFPEGVPPTWMTQEPPQAWCMRFDPLDDLRQPGLLSVAAQASMSPAEVERFQQLDLSIDDLARWVFIRMAAKDAVRVLWKRNQGDRLFMADVEIEEDEAGRMTPQLRESRRPDRFPYVSVAHCDGIIVALASIFREVGVAVDKLPDAKSAEAARQALEAELSPDEEFVLQQVGDDGSRLEWLLRVRCAKKALAAADGVDDQATRDYRLVDAAVNGSMGLARSNGSIAEGAVRAATRRWKDYITAAVNQPGR